MYNSRMIKLHLGCGPNVKIDYINIDKYVSEVFAQEFNVKRYDVLNLPFADHTVGLNSNRQVLH